jgi:hypothetical protein
MFQLCNCQRILRQPIHIVPQEDCLVSRTLEETGDGLEGIIRRL